MIITPFGFIFRLTCLFAVNFQGTIILLFAKCVEKYLAYSQTLSPKMLVFVNFKPLSQRKLNGSRNEKIVWQAKRKTKKKRLKMIADDKWDNGFIYHLR